jgi:hypothetical protein
MANKLLCDSATHNDLVLAEYAVSTVVTDDYEAGVGTANNDADLCGDCFRTVMEVYLKGGARNGCRYSFERVNLR